MYMIREVFRAQRGKAPALIAVFKTLNQVMMAQAGFSQGKIYADMSGPMAKDGIHPHLYRCGPLPYFDRLRFHISEFTVFVLALCWYFRAIGERETAVWSADGYIRADSRTACWWYP